MKILFINISDTQGGSAIAAYRLGNEISRSYEAQNQFLVRSKRSSNTKVLQTRKNGLPTIIERSTNIFMNVLGLQYQWLPFSPKYILKKAREFNPDIISLHNTIGGYFRTADLITLSSIAPIVWTMHDMWPITRNAAHTMGDQSFTQGHSFSGENKIFPWIGLDTGDYLINRKKEIYKNSDISFVAPSQWLYNLASKSPLLTGKTLNHIYHGIDTDRFSPIEKEKARMNLDLDPKTKTLLFVAEKIKSNDWKGGEDLFYILSKLSESKQGKFNFIILGDASNLNLSYENINIVTPGFVNDENKMVQYYNAADLFVYPTRAESFGLVLAESIACRTPCVSYNVGPVGEIVKDGVSGILADAGDKKDLFNKVAKLIIDDNALTELAFSCRNYAISNFSLSAMARNYYKLFESKISESG